MSTLKQVLRERALAYLMRNQAVPAKMHTKKTKKRSDWGLSKLPGDSRNHTVSAIKAIAADHQARLATQSEERRIGQLAVRAGRVVVKRV